MILKKPKKSFWRWRHRFALFPVRIGDDLVWLQWYWWRWHFGTSPYDRRVYRQTELPTYENGDGNIFIDRGLVPPGGIRER